MLIVLFYSMADSLSFRRSQLEEVMASVCRSLHTSVYES